ncbi:MAG: translation initiation factor IF-2 [Firmicutes bacterium]|nr:translation initiation factor IF-2 [Bacillota bacterium]
MGKIRVHELAKELGVNSKELINKLQELGIPIKNHMSTLEDYQVARIKEIWQKKTPAITAKTETPTVVEPPQRKERRETSHLPETQKTGVQTVVLNPPKSLSPNQASSKGNQPRQTGEIKQIVKERVAMAPHQPTGFKGSPHGTKDRVPQGGYDRIVHPRPASPEDRRPTPQGDRRPTPQGDRRPVSQGERRPPQDERGTGIPRDRFGTNQKREQVASPVKILPVVPPVPPVPIEGQRRDKTVRPERGPASGKKRVEERDFVDERLLMPRGKKGPGGAGKGKSRGDVAVIATPKLVKIPGAVTVQELAGLFKRSPAELIKKLMALGILATINQEVDPETAIILGTEFGINVEVEVPKTAEDLLEEIVDPPEYLVERPPVVTVMGHVDHGKTSLLDAIRETNVTAQEAGGITQHIGAYQVEINGKKITFIDTPGHEAFTAMRARGAQVTDIAILVVAADDGVMPQTIEAINHAKAAGVPIIVAINKIDKANANPDRVKQQLTEYGLVPEEWGGDTICVPVSAHTRENLDTLLEMILLVAEMSEIKANPNRPAKGTVIEAQLDKGRGPVATVLVQHGTLKVGDSILVGLTSGKVRAMIDDKGRRVKKAGPSTPVEVLGLSEVPMAGDIFQVVTDEKLARQITAERQNRKREEELQKTARVTLDDLFKQIKEGQVKELNIIIKADVQGSIEALRQALERLSTDEVRVNPIHGGVGAITETDVMLASASNAIIIGFNVRPDSNTRRAAEAEQVDIRLYRVIYDAIEDIKAAMSGLLEPEWKEVVLGRAEVRATFKIPKAGTVAGCYVTEGKITKTAEIRVIRDGIVIHEGKVESLRRFKDDVKEVSQGFECGLGIEKFNDIKEGDILEAFTMEKVQRAL